MTTDPTEDDPTGMRHLLSGMSDPHPASDDLVARISASLAQEREAAGRRPHVTFDPAVTRPRRRRRARVAAVGTVLAGAAAVAFVAVQLPAQGSETAVRAAVGPPSSTPSSPAPGGSTPSAGPIGPVATTPPGTASLVHMPTVVASGTDYRLGHLTQQVRRVALDPSSLPGASEGGTDIAWCLEHTTFRSDVVDVATFDGEPALVLLSAPDASGLRQVLVLPTDCAKAGSEPLAGPATFR